MTNDAGLKPEGAPERFPKAGAGAPSSGEGNGPKRFSVQRKMAIVARLLRVDRPAIAPACAKAGFHYNGIENAWSSDKWCQKGEIDIHLRNPGSICSGLNVTKIWNDTLVSKESRSTTADQPANFPRRTVLAFAVAAVVVAAARVQVSAESVSAALHRLFGGNAGLREFGRIFHAREADAAARLLARLDGLDGSAVCSRVDALRKEDFAAGRVVVINGWVLARTEAEACAFIAVG